MKETFHHHLTQAAILIEEHVDWLEDQRSMREREYRSELMEAGMPVPLGGAKKKSFDLRLTIEDLDEKIGKHKGYLSKLEEIWEDITNH